ncbi:MAG: Asp-tRNA(Asn)/Glu-tRNA(Gln) amidotransferase GatCAB subunit A [SAR202 cluster bacterium]|nr:Asp-tRNA(Asn)/Glu-tRNA(Gln) amidotransferase GatCAB subunit A [SAR202 cluster bacterium]
MATTPLHYLTIAEASRLIQGKKLSPVELTQAFLDRIDKLDGKLATYITLTADIALAEAKKAEADIARGTYKGSLHGIPIALKDNYGTKGIRTTAASRVLADNVPAADSTAWARLKAAGAVLLGKLTLSEFACGGPDPETGFPMPRNPWDLTRNAGGSSNGSAIAISAGLCMASMGTCTRGSIRAPASFCNVVGLKPTYGRISRNGVIPLSWTLDHCGPMTATVEDAAIMLGATAGHDPADPTSSAAPVPDYRAALKPDVRGLRIGVPRHFYFPDRPDVQREPLRIADAALRKLEQMGARVEEIEIPSLKYSDPAALVLLLGEGFAYHQRKLLATPELYGPIDRTEFRVASLFTLGDYVQAQRARSLLQKEYLEALKTYDLIAGPSFAIVAPAWDGPPGMAVSTAPSFTGMYNLTGLPAISVPAGFTPGGLPSGLQLAGKPFDEATVLRAAYAYEQATDWHKKRPPL